MHSTLGSTGGYKEISSISADQKRSRIWVPMRGDWGGCGISSNEYSCAHHLTWSPNKLWRSTSIFNLWFTSSHYRYPFTSFSPTMHHNYLQKYLFCFAWYPEEEVKPVVVFFHNKNLALCDYGLCAHEKEPAAVRDRRSAGGQRSG
jgi:hypothetical protein